jgi:hypothetical protein
MWNMGELAAAQAAFRDWILLRWKEWEAEKHWPYMLCQITAFAASIWWIGRSHLPWPGVSVALIAVLAALMSIEREMRGRHKAVYFVLMAALLITEFRAMKKDREEGEQQQRTFFSQQQTAFQAIDNQAQQNFQSTTGQTQRNFEVTVQGLQQSYIESQRQFNATMEGISREIGTFTGGNSYVTLLYTPGNLLLFVHRGEYPLFSVMARIVDLDDPHKNLFGGVVNVGDLTKGHGVDRLIPPELARIADRSADRVDLNIFFTARNGDWTEQLRMRRMGNEWKKAVMIEGAFSAMKKGEILCWGVDKDFPIDSLDKWFPKSGNSRLHPCP